MNHIFAVIGAFLGYHCAKYIIIEFPLLAIILGNEGTPSYLGRGSMPSGMLTFVGIILGGIVGYIVYGKIFPQKMLSS